MNGAKAGAIASKIFLSYEIFKKTGKRGYPVLLLSRKYSIDKHLDLIQKNSQND